MTDVEELDADFPLILDPTKPMIISAWGAKGTGKSVFNSRIYQSYPFDKIAVDVNGNAYVGDNATKISNPLPGRFPEDIPALGERPRFQNLHYRAHPGSPTYRDDLDRAIGLGLFPQDRRCLLWAGEVGELTPNGTPGPRMRTALMQNRHYNLMCLFDGPRPINVDPLVLAQSDIVAVYRLPNPNDRRRVAETIGYPAARFEKECEETWRRGKFWFLLWHAETHQLYRCAPLPIEDLAGRTSVHS